MQEDEKKTSKAKAEDEAAAKEDHKKIKGLVAGIQKENDDAVQAKKDKVVSGLKDVPKRPEGSKISDGEWHTMNLGNHHFAQKEESVVQVASEHKHKKKHAKKHHHHRRN